MQATETERTLTGAQVKQLRLARRWSQKRLAQESGVSERMIRDLEADRHAPQPANLKALLDVLIVDGDPEETRASWPEDVRLYLDILGAYLAALPEPERLPEMKRLIASIAERQPRGDA